MVKSPQRERLYSRAFHSELQGYRAILAGNPRTAYRARIHVRQDDETLHDETLAGMTDDRGAAVEQDDLVVVAAEDEP